VEKASPPLAIEPSSPEPATTSDDAEVVRRWAAEPPKRPTKTVTIQGSSVPWRAAPTGAQGISVSPTATLFGVGLEPAVIAPETRTAVEAAPAPSSPAPEDPRNGVPSAASPVQTAALPFRVGRYEVATRIARGAMGSVYLCRDTTRPESGRLLTLKVIRQHAVKQDLAMASFDHEARIGSLFRHPNAQTVIDRGVFEGQPYLVLDYVDGGCLAELFTDETRPPPAVVVAVVLDILAALGALHRTTDSAGQPLGLIHCDVSPENVLVGVDGVARLADFGSARFAAESNQAQPFSLSKPPWMPPEQFTGDRLDSSSDVYSAGVLLWTTLTGHQPFADEGYDQTVLNVMNKKIPPPSALGAPTCLDGVCMQAMSRFRDRRFMLADAMAAALRATAAGENLVASRETVGAWVQRAVGDDLAQRRRLVASVFGGGEAPRDALPLGSPGTSRRDGARPRTPAGAEKVLSSRTIFMPAADDPDGDTGPIASAPAPHQKRLLAVIVVTVTMTITFSLVLAVKSWSGRRAQAKREQAAAAAMAAPAPPTIPRPSVEPSIQRGTSPAETPNGP
jgi:eukaryotic-like serine/threonine-protein kinase